MTMKFRPTAIDETLRPSILFYIQLEKVKIMTFLKRKGKVRCKS